MAETSSESKRSETPPEEQGAVAPQGPELQEGAMRNVWLLGGTSFFTDFSSDMTYSLRGILVTAVLGGPAWAVGLIEGVAESLASILKLFSGALSDWLGRRKEPAIAGYSTSIVGKFLVYLSGTQVLKRLLKYLWRAKVVAAWPMVFLGQVVDRVGKGVRTAPRDALIADGIRPEYRGRAFGIQRTLDHAGALLGAVTCYFLLTRLNMGDTDIHKVFLYAIIPGIVGVLLLFFVKEIRKPTKVEPWAGEAAAPGLYWRWMSLDRRLRVFLVIVFLFSLANFSNQFMLLKLKFDLGYSTPKVVLHYALFNALAALLAYPAGKISDRLGRKGIVAVAYLFYGAVYLGLAAAGPGVWTWILFAAYGLYLAMTQGVEKALVSDLAPAHARATALGLYAMLVGVGILPASLVAGGLFMIDPAIPFVVAGVMSAAAGLALWFLLDMKDDRSSRAEE